MVWRISEKRSGAADRSGDGGDGDRRIDGVPVGSAPPVPPRPQHGVVWILVSRLYRFALSLPASFLLILIGAAPRLINLGSEHLWFDEAFQWLVSQPKTDLWKAIIGDTHPPLWGLIQAFNLQLFGGSEWTFRLPSAVAGIASILMIYQVALALKLGKRAALTSGMIAALMPGLIYFSQDARPYSFLLFLVLLCLWGAIRGNWIVYLAAGAAAAYTQHTGLIYAGVIGLTMLAVHRRRGMVILCGVGLLIMYAPWIPILIHQARAVSESYWVPPINWGNFLKSFLDTSVGTRIPQIFQIPVVAAWGGLTMISLSNRRWLFRRRTLPFWAVLIGAPVALGIYSVAISNVYVFRSLLPSGAVLAILWGNTFSKLKGEHFKIFRSLAIFSISLSLMGYYATEARADLNQILAPVRERWQDGDVIYFSNATSAIMFNKYLWERERDFRIAPLPGSIMNITSDVKTAFGLSILELEAAPAEITFRRLWYVGGLSPFSADAEWKRYREIASKAAYLHAWGGIHFRNFIILYTP